MEKIKWGTMVERGRVTAAADGNATVESCDRPGVVMQCGTLDSVTTGDIVYCWTFPDGRGIVLAKVDTDASLMSAADKARMIGMPGYNLLPGYVTETTGSVTSSGVFKGITVGSFLTGLAGVPVAVSFDAKGNAGDTLRVYAYQSSGLSIDTASQAPEMFTLAADWQRFSFTAHVKQWAASLNPGMIGFWIQGGTVQFKLKRIKIETGTSATVWTPSAEDIAVS